MARPRAIKPEELTMLTQFKVLIVKFKEHQDAKTMAAGRMEFLKLKSARTTDTIDDEKFEVQGLFFAILRHSAGGRLPGKIVAGNDKSLTLGQLAKYLRKSVEELLPPLKRLMLTNRIRLLVATTENPDEEEEPEEDREPEKTEPSEKVKQYRACRMFWLAWEELHIKSYNRQYDKTQWDEVNLQKILKSDNLHRYIAYAFHFHQQDSRVGIPKLKEKSTSKLKTPTVDNFLKRASDYSTELRGKEWTMSQKWSTEFLKKHQSLQ